MQTIKKHKYIILIILLAAFLRLYGLSRGDTMSDESLMAFRAIGMIDFDEAAYQTTPFEWFDPNTTTQHCAYSTEQKVIYVINQERLGSIPISHMQKVCDAVFGVGVDPKVGIPWWAHLSWHDHPALVFLVQHIFISLFGKHTWAFRLPSAILGIVSVYLIYLIGNLLWTSDIHDVRRPRSTGLFSALIYAVTLNGVYISRTGLQESYVIFFILLALYFFLKGLEKEKYFIFAGIVLGLGTLAKYTTFFVVAPIIFMYLTLFRRDVFYKKVFWLGIVLFFVVVSPSIIYNIELYRAVGHFDFQLSTIFRQAHPAWQVQPGKDIGSIADRARDFMPRLIATNSWMFLSLFAISILGFLYSVLRNGSATVKQHAFLVVSFVCVFALLIVIGPSYRFLTMLAPFMALAIGFIAKNLMFLFSNTASPRAFLARPSGLVQDFTLRSRFANRPASGSKPARWLAVFAAVMVLFEIFYSWNNQIAYYSVGDPPAGGSWLASKVKYENYSWGYNELNDYFENEFEEKIPALTFDLRYQFLNKLRDDALESGLQKGYQKYPALIVYFGNFDQAGRLWTLDRLHIYHAWPIISLIDYENYLAKNGPNFYKEAGFKNYYFVMPANSVPTIEFTKLVPGVIPIEIKNPRGDTAFLIYKTQ